MSQPDFLAQVLSRLEVAHIPYMVVGSLGSTHYGEPRSTNDVDIVIDPSGEALTQFLASFGSEFYVSTEAALDAFQRRSMFNIIDLKMSWKADLIFRKDSAFDREEFNRRRQANMYGQPVWLLSPEDSILSKLAWAKLGASERQVRDARGVAAMLWASLDQNYLRKWAGELGVSEQLEVVLREAQPLQPPGG